MGLIIIFLMTALYCGSFGICSGERMINVNA